MSDVSAWRRLLVAAVVCAAAACGTTGPPPTPTPNGIQSETGAKILQAATVAIKGFTSVHMKGLVTTKASATSPAASIELDLEIVPPHKLLGTMAVAGSGSVQIITVDGSTVAMTGDNAFWTTFGSAKAAALLGGRCVLVGPSVPGVGEISSSVAHDADLSALLALAGAAPTVGTLSTVDGQDVIGLIGLGAEIDIATHGPAYLVRVKPGAGTDHLDFDRWNAFTAIGMPAGCQDISQFH